MDWGSVDYFWIIVMFLSAVWTLILTAHIHCRGSIGDQVIHLAMQNFNKSAPIRNKHIYILDDLKISEFSSAVSLLTRQDIWTLKF